ncbi:MAG: zinc ABC transporter solute-binding protein [Myxococcales bacterium]|nr:zinc ABC transporter solute-binding protein [Myxococcales bacterium]
MRLPLLLSLFGLIHVMPAPVAAKVRVVGTLPDFAAIATEIGGERVEASSLIQGTEDPHFVDPKPSHVLRLNTADLLICIGMGLEVGWLPALLAQSRNAAIQPGGAGYLDASMFIQPEDVPTVADRALGDVHAAGNPHYYTSPAAMRAVAEGIYKKLLELDPEGRAEIERRWMEFATRYERKLAEWKAAFAAQGGTRVVEYHRSWVYLLGWAGWESAGALEPKPGIPPSPAHVGKLLQTVRDRNVRFVIQEVYFPDRLSRLFADKAGARLVKLPSMVGAAPDVRTVEDKFERIVKLLTAPSE